MENQVKIYDNAYKTFESIAEQAVISIDTPFHKGLISNTIANIVSPMDSPIKAIKNLCCGNIQEVLSSGVGALGLGLFKPKEIISEKIASLNGIAGLQIATPISMSIKTFDAFSHFKEEVTNNSSFLTVKALADTYQASKSNLVLNSFASTLFSARDINSSMLSSTSLALYGTANLLQDFVSRANNCFNYSTDINTLYSIAVTDILGVKIPNVFDSLFNKAYDLPYISEWADALLEFLDLDDEVNYDKTRDYAIHELNLIPNNTLHFLFHKAILQGIKKKLLKGTLVNQLIAITRSDDFYELLSNTLECCMLRKSLKHTIMESYALHRNRNYHASIILLFLQVEALLNELCIKEKKAKREEIKYFATKNNGRKRYRLIDTENKIVEGMAGKINFFKGKGLTMDKQERKYLSQELSHFRNDVMHAMNLYDKPIYSLQILVTVIHLLQFFET